jgi:hypothetical protein
MNKKIEIMIDENGDLLLNNDNKAVLSIIQDLLSDQDYEEFLSWINEKPKSLIGDDTISFCG